MIYLLLLLLNLRDAVETEKVFSKTVYKKYFNYEGCLAYAKDAPKYNNIIFAFDEITEENGKKICLCTIDHPIILPPKWKVFIYKRKVYEIGAGDCIGYSCGINKSAEKKFKVNILEVLDLSLEKPAVDDRYMLCFVDIMDADRSEIYSKWFRYDNDIGKFVFINKVPELSYIEMMQLEKLKTATTCESSCSKMLETEGNETAVEKTSFKNIV